MHFVTEEDRRNDTLIWILIDAHRGYPGYIDQATFDASVARYQRELKKKDIDLSIYFDCVSGQSKEVWNACYSAMEFELIGMQRPGRTRAPVEASIKRYLLKQTHLTQDEVQLAKEAAKATHSAELQGKLDDDLEKQVPAATQ